MTAFGMIQRMRQDDGGEPVGFSRGYGGGASRSGPAVRQFGKRVVIDAPAPRPRPAVESFVNRLPAAVVDTPAPAPVPATTTAPDLPPILPADVAPKPKAAGVAGFFDQELIPGVKNLYLAGGLVGLLLIALLARKK